MATAGADCSGAAFPHEKGSLVLVKWNDGMVYFAKIKKIDRARRKCVVIFDDRSTDEASFSQIHSVDETTTDIICIKCKKDESEHPNEIVLCDKCGIGFHQKCHSPPIPASALELNSPWHCVYCVKQMKNPYLTESIDVMQSLFEEDEDDSNRTLPNQVVKVKVERKDDEEAYMPTSCASASSSHQVLSAPPKKRKVGRPRMSESGGSRRSGNKMRPLEALRRKLAKTASGRGRGGARRRQPSHHHDPSSRFGVESHTLSVQQTSEGILSTSSSAVETTNEDDETDSESLITAAKRPRSLRVSLTLPPSVDTSPVSSTTQRSPPQAQLPWRQMDREERSVDASESSPEPTLQIKEEDSENEENGGGKGGESSPASVSVVTVSTDSDQQQTNDSQHDKSVQNIISNTGPPPLSSALPPPPLMELDSTSNNTQDKEASSCVGETKKQSEEVLVISSSTVSPKDISTTTNAGSADNAAPVEATQQSMETDQDVIIIEDNSTSSRKRKTSPLPSSSNDTLITTSSKLATTVTKTSVSTPDRSLVKVVPGVTSLMPSKHSRKSVIHNTSQHTTPSPVSTPSPLEQLQIQVHKQALMSRGSIYSGTSTTSNRRNSYQGSSNNNSTQFRRTNSAAQPSSSSSSSSSSSISSTHVSAVTTTVTPPGSTPLSHINEESVYTEKDARSLNTHRQLSHTDRVSMLSSSSNVSSLQHRKDSPATIKPTLATVSNIGRSVKAFDQRAFTKEIITSTRSRKPLAPPMHYVSEAYKVQEKSPIYKPSSGSESTTLTSTVRQPSTAVSSVSTSIAPTAPAYDSGGYNLTNTVTNNSNIPTSPAAVVVTPTTITATGEVGTVYTLMQADQVSSFQPEMASHVSSKEAVVPSHQVAVLAQPATAGVHTAVVAVAASDASTPMQQSQSVVPYYTLVELPDNTAETIRQTTAPVQYAAVNPQQVLHQSTPTVNTTKPYAVVNALPSGVGQQQQGPPLQLKSPPPSFRMQPGRHRKHRTPSANSPPSNTNYARGVGASSQLNSSSYSQHVQQQVVVSSDPPITNSIANKTAILPAPSSKAGGKEKGVQVIIGEKEETMSDLIRQLGAIKNKRKRDFDNMSEESLMTLFHSALKQFKENGKKYEQHISRPIAPPNVEVLDNSGVPVQQTSRNSRVVRPKPQRIVNQGISLLAQHQRIASPSSSSSSASSPFQPSRRLSPPSYSQHQLQSSSVGSKSLQQQTASSRDRAPHQVQTSGVFVPPPEETRANSQQSSLQQREPQYHKTQQQFHVHSKTPVESEETHHHFIHSSGAQQSSSTLQQQQTKYMQQGQTTQLRHQYTLASPSQQVGVAKYPQQQFSKPGGLGTRQIVKNNRTYLIADSPATASTVATGSVVVRRPTHTTNNITTSINPSGPLIQHQVAVGDQATAVSSYATQGGHVVRENILGGAGKRDRMCTFCGRDATFLCSGCHKEWYCGRDCQLKAWDDHANVCKSY